MDPISMFFLFLLFGCRGSLQSGGGGTFPGGGGYPELPEPGWPGSPVTYTPPWPQALPGGLPKFPGPGWEFDEPPPKAVQQRAGQVVDVLWKQGSGAFRTEQTAGRWITYQAQVVASGKRGVVAYRLKQARALPPQTSAQRQPATRPPAASQPNASTTPAPSAPQPTAYTAVSPGQPQPAVQPAVTLPVLKRGAGIKPKAPSPNVKLLQQRLGISADGQFGGGTEQALKTFQREHGLDADGIVGPKTWAALFATGRL